MKLFVYGTLKQDFGNHTVVPPPDEIVRAEVCGTLYNLGYFPALELGEKPIRYASEDIFNDVWGDVATQEEPGQPRVVGELFTFNDVRRAFHALNNTDILEGFNPLVPEFSNYRRALVRVSTPHGPVAAWTYFQTGLKGIPKVEGGEWYDYYWYERQQARKEIDCQ